MNYKDDIDAAIIQLLSEFDEMGYLELHSKVGEKVGWKGGAYSVLSFHLDQLQKERLIRKKDSGKRGVRVPYSLTSKGEKQFKLDIVGREPRQLLLRKIYINLIFHGLYQPTGYKLTDIDSFLSELGTTAKALHVHNVEEEKDFLYPEDNEVTKPNTKQKRFRKTHYEPVDGVTISRSIFFDIKDDVERVIRDEYWYSPPGITETEYVDGGFFDQKLEPAVVEKAFELLSKIGLLRKVIFKRSPRYVINDDTVSNFMNDLHELCDTEQFMLKYKWSYFSDPTAEEARRAELYYGKEDARLELRNCEMTKYQHFKTLKKNAKESGKRAIMVENEPDKIRYLNSLEENFLDGLAHMRGKYAKTILRREEFSFIHEVIQAACPRLLQERVNVIGEEM